MVDSMTLTQTERDFIFSICLAYGNNAGCEGTPELEHVVEGEAARSATLSALVDKGLVWIQGAVCGFTDEGKKLARELYPDDAD